MKRIISVSAIAMLIASFATVAVAGDHRGRGKHKRGDRFMKMAGQLDLTPEQRDVLKKIHAEKRAESKPLVQKIRSLKEEMRSKWSADSPDEKGIMALQEQIHALKGQLAELRIESRMDTLAVLTPEQREQLAALRAERRANRKGKRFGKNGRGRGDFQGMSVDPSLQ